MDGKSKNVKLLPKYRNFKRFFVFLYNKCFVFNSNKEN